MVIVRIWNRRRDLARERLVLEGHLDFYQREIVSFQKNRLLLQRSL